MAHKLKTRKKLVHKTVTRKVTKHVKPAPPSQGIFLVIGDFDYGHDAAPTVSHKNWMTLSRDAGTWTNVEVVSDTAGSEANLMDMAWNGTCFIAMSDNGAIRQLMKSTDGFTGR